MLPATTLKISTSLDFSGKQTNKQFADSSISSENQKPNKKKHKQKHMHTEGIGGEADFKQLFLYRVAD